MVTFRCFHLPFFVQDAPAVTDKFEAEGIDDRSVLDLTDGDLKELGVKMGARKRILRRIRALLREHDEPAALEELLRRLRAWWVEAV